MNAELEVTPCPLCGSDRREPKLQAPDRFEPEFKTEFQVVRCADCPLIYLNPRPTREAIARFYASSGYDPFLSTQEQRDFWSRLYGSARNYMVRRKRAWIEAMKSSGALLDVGCGTGEFLHEMRSHGWQVTGVETESKAAAFARKKYGLDVASGDLEACEFKSQQFDIVTFWHVLEHLFEPVQTLRKVNNILKPDGVVLIAVPNIAGVDARFYKENWVALDAPRHLTHFTPESLSRLATLANFSVAGFRQMPLDAFYNCLMSEQLVRARRVRGKGWLPLYMLRGLGVAAGSVILASRILRRNRTGGSSILYTLKRESWQ